MYNSLRTTLTVGDIAGDGSKYMIVGNNKGGVELYKLGYPPVLKTPAEQQQDVKISLYPNPAHDVLHVAWQGISQTDVQLSIINMMGQQLYATSAAAAAKNAVIPVSMLPAGVYVCVVQGVAGRWHGEFSVVQ